MFEVIRNTYLFSWYRALLRNGSREICSERHSKAVLKLDSGRELRVRKVDYFSILLNLEILFCRIFNYKE